MSAIASGTAAPTADVGEPARVEVLVPGLLRSYTGGAPRVALDLQGGSLTVGGVLAALDARFRGFAFRIVDEQGAIRPHIKIFVDATLARSLDHALRDGAEMMIVGALSGG